MYVSTISKILIGRQLTLFYVAGTHMVTSSDEEDVMRISDEAVNSVTQNVQSMFEIISSVFFAEILCLLQTSRLTFYH